MLSRELTDRFHREYEPLLHAVEDTLAKAAPPKRRHTAVRLLNARLIEHFTGEVSRPEEMSTATRHALDGARQTLSKFEYSIDESIETDRITPEILGILVERYAADQVRHGAFYTPSPIVRHMCGDALRRVLGDSPSENLLAGLRVVDPGCGSGAFLVGMFYALFERYRRAGKCNGETNARVAEQIISQNLYGGDLDDLAVEAARLRLQLACAAVSESRLTEEPLCNLQVANSLQAESPFEDERFDIVVTNPPFGVTLSAELRDQYFASDGRSKQSKDAYGLFVAWAVQRLKPGGVAGLLISDTWRTIVRHRPLRKRLTDETTVHSVVDLPGWVFSATVNTGILTLSKTPPSHEHVLIAADLRPTPRDNWVALESRLNAITNCGKTVKPLNDAEYTYPQGQIAEYENLSFFIASPRLHRIMTDSRFTTLGEIATVRQGLATGDNKRYLRKRAEARGNYKEVDPTKLLRERELERMTNQEKINGVIPEQYQGRQFVPYDKGGASAPEDGWLPNYYVPTEYFIDWSDKAVHRMKTATSSRQRGKVAARFQNSEQYFKQGITFSYTGFYSPCFRLSSGGVFDVGGSSCFDLKLPLYPTLAVLASKLLKYLARNYVNHTVNFQVDDFKALPLPRSFDMSLSAQLDELVAGIVTKQKANPRYPYHLHEQIEIDRLVYQLFGLTDDDIREVERWYGRRYGRLGGSDKPRQLAKGSENRC